MRKEKDVKRKNREKKKNQNAEKEKEKSTEEWLKNIPEEEKLEEWRWSHVFLVVSVHA
jgi:hypothetical protein